MENAEELAASVMEAEAKATLADFIERNADQLLSKLRHYVWRADLARNHDEVERIALDLLGQTVDEALTKAGRYNPQRGQPMVWLLGIAANLIKRRQDERKRHGGIERTLAEVRASRPGTETLSDAEVFDKVAALAASVEGPEEQTEATEQAEAMLSLLSEKDRHIVRLAVLNDLDGERVASALGVSPGNTRVRLHRALGRLRHALEEHRQDESNI